MTPTSAMIFAAGFGTRMRPLTDMQPKPMVPLMGRPMIDYAIDHARKAGATKIVSNSHYLPEVIEPHLAEMDVHCIRETPDILDTGGGLKNALPVLGADPIWTLNPDAVWAGPNPLGFAMKHWDPLEMDAMLVCVQPDLAQGTSSLGDFVLDTNNRIRRGKGVIYGGAQIIKPETLDLVQKSVFSLTEVWDALIERQRCYACVYPAQWCDIGHPEGLQLAETLLKGLSDD